MANELVLMWDTDIPIPFTCSNTVGIEKGTLLKMSDPMTVAAQTGHVDIVGGVAAEEKIASDGKTKIAVYRGGIFRAVASGSITVGDSLVSSGAVANNLLETAAVNDEQIFGIALETATNAETFLFELRPTTMQLA